MTTNLTLKILFTRSQALNNSSASEAQYDSYGILIIRQNIAVMLLYLRKTSYKFSNFFFLQWD